MTSGGETRRLGTGETAVALAGRDEEGSLVRCQDNHFFVLPISTISPAITVHNTKLSQTYDPLEHNGWESPRKDEDKAKYK